MSKRVLIFGGSSPAGTYLLRHLRQQNQEVWATFFERTPVFFKPPHWRHCDLTDPEEIYDIMDESQPEEVYNFASLNAEQAELTPTYCFAVASATATILKRLWQCYPETRYFQAGSASVFYTGIDYPMAQYEDSPRWPTSVYGVSKLAVENLVRVYRDKGLFASTGIFFNMESPLRTNGLVAYAVREAVRMRHACEQGQDIQPLQCGNLESVRDYGWAPELVRAAPLMLQAAAPRDYVIGTGQATKQFDMVSEILAQAAVGFEPSPGSLPRMVLEIDKQTSGHVDYMHAAPAKIELDLGWKAQYGMKDIARMLVQAERDQTEKIQIIHHGQSHFAG